MRRASGDATISRPISWTLFPWKHGRIAPLIKQKQLRAPCPFGRSESCFLRFYAKERQGHDAESSDSRRDPEAGCSQWGTLRAQRAEDWCSQTGALQTDIPNTASDGLAPSTFDPSPEYSTDKVVLFW